MEGGISILTKESQSESRDLANLANLPQRILKAPAPRTPFFRALVVNRHSEFSFRFVFKSPKSKTKSHHVWSQNDYILKRKNGVRSTSKSAPSLCDASATPLRGASTSSSSSLSVCEYEAMSVAAGGAQCRVRPQWIRLSHNRSAILKENKLTIRALARARRQSDKGTCSQMAERIAAQMRDEYGPTRKAAKAERAAMLTAKASASLRRLRESRRRLPKEMRRPRPSRGVGWIQVIVR